MRKSVDDYFVGKDSPADFERLQQRLVDWSLWGGYDSFEMFQIWEMSGYKQLPFDGAWVDQPSFVRNDFLMLLQVKRWWSMNEKLEDGAELPKLEDN